ncbi:unnamed protein product [Moneuplotes crassus]|uniref:RING-type domain-containing protein n=1 Tax=Euplotes crassus TaxID=5936 RepID=A0AAD1U5Y1_EUPCR|nr:unnamed protein product [Moneuplotes crassus]
MSVYTHLILLYVYIIRAFFNFSNDYIILSIQLATTMYNHIVISEYYLVDDEDISEHLDCEQWYLKIPKCLCICDCIYLNTKVTACLKKNIRIFEFKFKCILTFARYFFCIMSLMMLVRVLITHERSSTDIEIATVLSYFYIVVSLLKNCKLMSYISLCVFLAATCPLMMLLSLFLSLMGYYDEEPGPALNQVMAGIEEIVEQEMVEQEISESESHEEPPNNNEEVVPNNFSNLIDAFNAMAERVRVVERIEYERLVRQMIKDWKRAYSGQDQPFSPNCCVCFDNFKVGEKIIELPCDPKSNGHIFHILCINNWAQQHKTCPLCRTDFIEILKQQNIDRVMKNEDDEEEESNYRNSINSSVIINQIMSRSNLRDTPANEESKASSPSRSLEGSAESASSAPQIRNRQESSDAGSLLEFSLSENIEHPEVLSRANALDRQSNSVEHGPNVQHQRISTITSASNLAIISRDS